VTWTGNRGTGTSGYRHYDRAHEVTADSPAKILGSSDPAFRGDPSRWNPELGEFPRPPRAPCAGGGRVIFPMPWDGASGDVADQALRLSTAGADRPTDA
jgi:hypothetical protein